MRNRPEIGQLSFVGASMSAQLLQLVLLAVVARAQAATGLGTLSLGLLSYTLISVLSTNGIAVFGARTVASSPRSIPIPIAEISVLRAVAATLLATAASVFAVAAMPETEAKVVAVFSWSALPPMLVPDWLLLGERRMAAYAVLGFAIRGIPLLGSLAVAAVALRLEWIAVGHLTGSIVVLLGAIATLRPAIVRRARRPSLAAMRDLTRAALPLGAGSVLNLLLLSGDQLLVRALLGTEALGVYAAGSRLIGGLISAEGLFVSTALPRVVEAKAASSRSFERVVRDTLLALLFTGVAIGALVMFFAPVIVGLLFGSSLIDGAAPVMRVYALVLVAFGPSMVLTNLVLVPLGRDVAYFTAILTGLTVLLLLAPLLASVSGVVGVAATALAAQVAVSVSAIASLRVISRIVRRTARSQ